MGSSAFVSLKDVWAMLEHCLGAKWSKRQTKHHWRVSLGAQLVALPLGPHGPRRNVEIEVGHVRHLARTFSILDCAKDQLTELG